MRFTLLFVAGLLGVFLIGSLVAQGTPDYATEIQPIFDASCTGCHSVGGRAEGTGMILTSYEETMAGDSNNGPAVIPGNADESLLIWKLEGVDNTGATVSRMPRGGGDPLSAETIQLVRAWIDAGALAEASPLAVKPHSWGQIKNDLQAR